MKHLVEFIITFHDKSCYRDRLIEDMMFICFLTYPSSPYYHFPPFPLTIGLPRTQFGLMTFDSSIHFYNLKSGLKSPQMLVVSDVVDVILPLPEDLLVNLQVRCVVKLNVYLLYALVWNHI